MILAFIINQLGPVRLALKEVRARVLLLCIISLISPPVMAEKITIAADKWCPFNCEASAELPGFMVEVAQQVFAEHGHEVDYVEMNWSRAIEETRRGRVNAVIGAFHGDAPDFIFPEEELTVLENYFFVRNDSEWTYQGIESLKGKRLGAILGYDYGEELNSYIKGAGSQQVIMLSGDIHPLKRGIQMLDLQRIDIMVETGDVFGFMVNRMGMTDRFKAVGNASEPMEAFLAFSPALESSGEYARLLSQGIRKLRETGELAAILAKYGLTDWR